MKFPKAFSTAQIKCNKVWFKESELDDNDELVSELIAWKIHMRINLITPNALRLVYSSGRYTREIFQLFKNSNKIEFLAKELKRRRVKTSSQ